MSGAQLQSSIEAATHRRLPRWWIVTALVLLATYLILTVVVVVGSPLDRLDLYLYDLRIAPKTTTAHSSVSWWVEIGQGVPCSTIAALYAIRRSLVTRTWTPWVMFCLALISLNVGVGTMKHLTGRLGPQLTDQVHTVWAGGTIYPSGHAANAVVMYGLIALLAPVAYRRLLTKIAVFLSISIGMGTVLLNTHWVSDVFGGWVAGGLVLQLTWLLAPRTTALVERMAGRVRPVIGRWWAAVEFHQSPAARAASEARRAANPTADLREVVPAPPMDPAVLPGGRARSDGVASAVDHRARPVAAGTRRSARSRGASQKTVTIPGFGTRTPPRHEPIDAVR